MNNPHHHDPKNRNIIYYPTKAVYLSVFCVPELIRIIITSRADSPHCNEVELHLSQIFNIIIIHNLSRKVSHRTTTRCCSLKAEKEYARVGGFGAFMSMPFCPLPPSLLD
ncbi:hypothetical protein CDAR_193761 [Caerostris darwini]|uniref:Uncharacterized protein n=1 Tax=Caerostris darwini TaxID=1538125 RepID=A0AAV4UPA1_9ARAC|nr:hypothetical protein CDAR_193761 [Caerostris darwini]